ncbi:MAG: AsnC family transcriptional regulator, partial [Actinobacteria bacterium]|nr:AsnC family transcriptional regulator [Actinomycetota bacterium]
MDSVDREILGILQSDGRISWQMLGDRVHLSPNAAAERVRRLMREGV